MRCQANSNQSLRKSPHQPVLRRFSSAFIVIGLTMQSSKSDMQLLPFNSACPVERRYEFFRCAYCSEARGTHHGHPHQAGLISIRIRSKISSEQRCKALAPSCAAHAQCPAPSAMSTSMSAQAMWSSTNKIFMLLLFSRRRSGLRGACRSGGGTGCQRWNAPPNREKPSFGCEKTTRSKGVTSRRQSL